MQDGRTPTECLQGVICKSEDWHAGVAFLSVLFQILYKESSVNDKGTLYQLQKLINRTYVSRKFPNMCHPLKNLFLSCAMLT